MTQVNLVVGDDHALMRWATGHAVNADHESTVVDGVSTTSERT